MQFYVEKNSWNEFDFSWFVVDETGRQREDRNYIKNEQKSVYVVGEKKVYKSFISKKKAIEK